ncbi:MAG: hypothetical protein RIS36_1751 [Pseudomonadota bacterium]
MLASAACQEQIIHDLSEREANSVVSNLHIVRLAAQKVRQPDGRWAISVDRDQIVPALSYLETRRVLPVRDTKSAASKGGVIPSREEQWFRYERSVAVSIEESLSALPGVLDARVHVNLPDEDPLFGDVEQQRGSGSVLLVVDRGFVAGDDAVAALVAGAAGLSRDVVRVLKSEVVAASEVESLRLERSIPSDAWYVQSDLPLWPFVWWVVGGGVVVGGCGAAALRYARRRTKRKVTFALPKELDFEG